MSDYPLDLLDPAWARRDFAQYAWVARGEPLPDLAGEPVVAVDIETRPRPAHRDFPDAGLDPWRGELFGVAVGVPTGGGCAWYVPLRHAAPGSARENYDVAPVAAWLTGIVHGARLLVNHNIKFDLRFLGRDLGLRPELIPATIFDTMVAAHLVDEREPMGYALKGYAHRKLGLPPAEEAALKVHFAGQKKEYQDWSVAPVDVTARYACGDVERTLRVAAYLRPRLESEGVVRAFAAEMALLPRVAAAELRGTAVDVERLQRDQVTLMLAELQAHRQLEAALGGFSVNPNSGPELADAFTTKLGIPILVRKEPEEREDGTLVPGAPEFDDAALDKYTATFPQHAEVFWRIQQARALYHVRNSNVEPMLALQEGGNLHYDYKLLSPRTGTRMSCEKFAIQGLGHDYPLKDPLTRRAVGLNETGDPVYEYDRWVAPGGKKYVVARPGFALVFFDYSQIEYRCFAHYANSPKIIEAYRNDPTLDLHKWAAEAILEGLLPRDDAKHIHFGILYGMGDGKLQKKLSVGEDAARRMLARYRTEVPELDRLKESVKHALLARGYLKTLLGRRRRLEHNWERFRFNRRKKGVKDKPRGILPYQGVNALCQGSAGDLLKDRAPHADACARAHGGQLLFLVHDEFVFEIPVGDVPAFVAACKPVLETWLDDAGAPRLRVPIYVDCEVSTTSWADAVKYEKWRAA